MELNFLAENSSGAFKQIMVKLTSSANINEGDILVHLFLLDLIKGDYVEKISELIKRFIGVVISPRHTARKRLYAVYLSIELSLLSEHQEDVTFVAESIQTFLESNTDPEIQDKVYFSLQKIIGHAGARGIFVKSLVGIAKNVIFFLKMLLWNCNNKSIANRIEGCRYST